MTQIEIPHGETKRIVEDYDADLTYHVEVFDSDIRIGHVKAYANEGTTLEEGLKHTIDNLRGEQLFAYAVDQTATIRMNVASARTESQPTGQATVTDDVGIDILREIDNTGVMWAETTNSGELEAAELYLRDLRRAVDIQVSTNGDATLYVGFSHSGNDWHNVELQSFTGDQTTLEQIDTAHPYVKAYLDQNTDYVRLVGKGL